MTRLQEFVEQHGEEFAAMWQDEDVTLKEVVDRFRLQPTHLRAAATAMRLGRKESRGDGPPPPTPEEIAERVAEIQATWTPFDRWRRTVEKSRLWSLPCLAENSDHTAYSAGTAPSFMSAPMRSEIEVRRARATSPA